MHLRIDDSLSAGNWIIVQVIPVYGWLMNWVTSSCSFISIFVILVIVIIRNHYVMLTGILNKLLDCSPERSDEQTLSLFSSLSLLISLTRSTYFEYAYIPARDSRRNPQMTYEILLQASIIWVQSLIFFAVEINSVDPTQQILAGEKTNYYILMISLSLSFSLCLDHRHHLLGE